MHCIITKEDFIKYIGIKPKNKKELEYFSELIDQGLSWDSAIDYAVEEFNNKFNEESL